MISNQNPSGSNNDRSAALSPIRIGWLSRAAALGVTATFVTWGAFGPVRAEGPAKPAGLKSFFGGKPGVLESSGSKSKSTAISLNYLQAPWQKVLDDLARQSGTTLEAERLPTRKFSRRDSRKHSIDQALTVLNRELGPQGFRLSIQGDKLVLAETAKTKQEYARQDASQPSKIVEPGSRAADAEPRASNGRDVAKRSEDAGLTPVRSIPTSDELEAANRVVTASNRDEPAAATAPRQPRELPRLDRNASAAAIDPSAASQSKAKPRGDEAVRAVPMGENRAVVVGRILYDGFGPFAALVDDGPEGLQGFRVHRTAGRSSTTGTRGAAGQLVTPTAAPEFHFAVGIDRDANELVVQAEPKLIKQVVRLIETVDAVPLSSQQTVRAVATTKDATQIAKVLQPQIDRLAQAERVTGRGGRRLAQATRTDAAADSDEQPAPPARSGNRSQPRPAAEPDQKPAADDEKPKSSDLPSLIGSLKGDVTVEAMPDLGVLILKGNQKDVEAVMDVIREIERLSAGTAPETHLLFLKHVSSEGLASLLNSIYTQIGSIRSRTVAQTQSVSVIPIVRPNAILILASKVDMESVLALAEELDQPTDPQTEFEIFPLKHAVAEDVAATIEELYPAPAAQTNQQRIDAGLVPRVRVTFDSRSNSVIVQARPRDMAEIAALIKRLDTDESGAVNQIRIFQLKSATAEELATTLQDSLQSISSSTGAGATRQGGGGGGGGGGTRAGGGGGSGVKSAVLQFLTVDGGRERIVRSGILDDVNVVADVRTNSLVVTAPEQSMPLMAELIQQLDRPAASVAEIKVFTLENGDATQAVTLLEKLFPPPTQQGQGLGGNQGQTQGIQVLGAEDAGSGLIPLRFSVDPRTNSILAIGGAEALRVVQAILIRLDASDIRQRQTDVYRLKNSPAADVANAINTFLQSQRQVVTQADPNLFSPFEQIEREVVVVAEPVSNSLLISATPRFFDEIKDIVTRLDAAPAQVIIQALIVEVTLNHTDEFGVELGFQDPVLFSRSTFPAANITTIPITTTLPNGTQTTSTQIISQSGAPGFLFGNPNEPLGNNVTGNPGKVGAQGLGSFALGRVNGDLGYGGLVLSASSDAVNVLLRALAQRRRVDILSRPQIRTLDNQTAQIQVGQDVPVVNGLNTSIAGVVNPNVERLPAGIILTVTPRITPDKTVVMEVIAEKSLFLSEGVPLFTDSTGRTIEAPKKDVTIARSTVSVRDSQTAVMGGMITKSNTNEERKVPWLGDIPVLGHAFRYDYYQTRRTELLIFLTPRLISTDEDSELIKQIEMDRLNFIECEAEEIHGPLRGISTSGTWNAAGAGSTVAPPLPAAPPNHAQPAVPPAPAEFDAPTSSAPAAPPKPAPDSKKRPVGPTFFPQPKS